VGNFDNSPLGDWIAARRKELKLTQAALAHAIGVSQPHIYQLESGQSWNIPYLEIVLLSKALAIPGSPQATEVGNIAEILDALQQTYVQRVKGGGVLISSEPLIGTVGEIPESVTEIGAQARILVTGEGRVFTTPGEIPESGIEIDPSTLPVLGDDDDLEFDPEYPGF